MVRSHTVIVWNDYLPKKSLLVVSGCGWQTNFNVSPGPGLWSLVFGPIEHDLGPGPELDKKMIISYLTVHLFSGISGSVPGIFL